MTKDDAIRIIKRLKIFTTETTSTKEKARKVLVDAGLIKKNGEATDFYK